MSVLVATMLDVCLEEPPLRAHPVVGMGRYLSIVEKLVPDAPQGRALVGGAVAWLGGAGMATLTGLAFERLASRVPQPWGPLVRGLALWPLLSARLLFTEVNAVETALAESTTQGRIALGRIVSRQTSTLGEEEIRGAAIESLAENLSDSLVAPLFWYRLGGLPGAAVYRFANTADACWGYRNPRWQDAGRFAARADDLLNLIPARLTAALLVGLRQPRLGAEANKTSSPNAGWPMAAMALRLDLRLTKRDHYELNPGGEPPGPDSLSAALRAAARVAALTVTLAALSEHLTHRARGARS